MKYPGLFVSSSALLGSLMLAGCGLSGQVHPTAANTPSTHVHASGSTSSKTPAPSSTSTSPSSSATTAVSGEPSASSVPGNTDSPSTSSTGGSTVPAGQPTSPTAIEYTVNQQASIAQVQPQAWVAREGFNSHYVRVNTATAATSHGKVLVLTYSNFLLQETGTANSFGTGGDIVKTSAVSLTIPGFGSSTPITGTMTTVDGIQHSGPHVVLTFRAPDGLYCDLLSTTLSSSQIEQIAESMSEI